MSEPDLFVVCKNCSSEVSPYVTECPYCGQRVRKRAPKIDRRGDEEGGRPRRRAPSLGRLRREEIPGIAPDTRPVVTGLLILISLGITVAWAGGVLLFDLRTHRMLKKGSMPSDLDGAKPKALPSGVQNRMSDGDLKLDWFTKTFTPPFHSRLTLTRRRAHHKPQRLLTVRMDTWPGSFEVGSGMVTWTEGPTAYGFEVASRKRLEWTFPEAEPNPLYKSAIVAHTRHHVFFAVAVSDGFELYVAPRP